MVVKHNCNNYLITHLFLKFVAAAKPYRICAKYEKFKHQTHFKAYFTWLLTGRNCFGLHVDLNAFTSFTLLHEKIIIIIELANYSIGQT